ncbi:unnamed protein product [Ranitomeya imitator]|uniref:ribonuclease H n=1 Tax=Ranitomeya imitator TaxID=111125 RepID=A0ABN9LNN6_9NEOB|nr:unnamed protein product [Ranitomeya imitator]
MPFGLANAPSVFQSFMHDIFREYLDKFLIVYLDDILIFSDDWESHVKQISHVSYGGRVKHTQGRTGSPGNEGPPASGMSLIVGHPAAIGPNTATVLTGSMKTLVKGEEEGTLLAGINIIQTYKEGDLNIQEAGKIMSVQIIKECPKCPILKKGASYLFMGKVDDFGRGRIVGDSFVISYRAQQHQILTSIAKKPC